MREAGVNEKKEKAALPKRRKFIARRQGVTVQKILIFLAFFPAIEARWSSLFLRNRQVTRSNTGPTPDILTVVVMVFLNLSRKML